MASWFGKKRGAAAGTKGSVKAVLDGSGIEELVENKEAFSNYVDHKFQELDRDRDGKLSVKELEPAVADIGAALGLPAQGSSPDSDQIYSEVLNEFTHGKQEEVSKSEFKEVLSDILLGMAAGLKRDPIVILRINGEDLKEFVESPRFEPEAISIFSQMGASNASLGKCMTMALEQLSVEQGMPPASDSWVKSNIIDPVLQSFPKDYLEQPTSQEVFLDEFRKFVSGIALIIQANPVIIAHSENTFDGKGIRRLLANKFELYKTLASAWKDLPKDRNHKVLKESAWKDLPKDRNHKVLKESAWKDLPKDRNHKVLKEYFRIALDSIAPSAGLPPYGAVNQVDAIVNEAFKIVNADEGKSINEEEFNKTMTEILGCIMQQLEGNPIFVSSNSVVNEPLASSSSVLSPSLKDSDLSLKA